MVQLAVVDTHALVWYSTGAWKKLGRNARSFLERADRDEAAAFIPTLVAVELMELERLGRIRFPDGAVQWLDGLFASGRFFPADLTVDVVRQAQKLYSIPERTDRLIAATAVALGMPLVTRDPEIARTAGVQLVW